MTDTRPIGVFDSGVGGLTVVRSLMERLPDEPIVYIGDTARFPYGPRPVEEIRRFGMQIADELIRRDVKMLVVACNSVEVSAIDQIAARHGVPVIGVVEPGARAAATVTTSGKIGMIGTEATVKSGAYDRAVAAADTQISLVSTACPSFVDHVEAGDIASDELRRSARLYLGPLMAAHIDTLILGCTHYPLLTPLLRDELGGDVALVSSAEETAKDAASMLDAHGLQAASLDTGSPGPAHRFFTTGDEATFDALAAMFLGPDGATVSAEHLSLPEVAWS